MSSIVVKPGQSAVGRTTVLIIMMIDAALGQLKDLGYERGFDDLEIVDADGFPYIKFKGELLFEVYFDADPERGLAIKGDWRMELPPKRRFIWARRFYRWVIKKLV
jgi:hypothetical protein